MLLRTVGTKKKKKKIHISLRIALRNTHHSDAFYRVMFTTGWNRRNRKAIGRNDRDGIDESITISRLRARGAIESQAIESRHITRGEDDTAAGCSCFFFCSLETASAGLPSHPPCVRRPSHPSVSHPPFRSSSFWARGALRGTFFSEMHPLVGSRHRKDRPVDLLSRLHVRGTHGPVITSLARILIRA